MIDKIHIYNNKSCKIVKTIDKEDLLHNDELKDDLRKKYLNKDFLKLVCGCNKDIELNIDSSNRIYHKKRTDLHRHNKFCFKHPDYEKKCRINGWLERDKFIYANVSNKLKDKDAIALYDFVKLFNLYSWNTYVYKNKAVSIDRFEFLNRLYGISNKIKLSNFDNKTLNDIYFDMYNCKKLSRNDVKFSYMYLNRMDFNTDTDDMNIVGEYAKGKTFSFVANKKVFNKKYFKIKNQGINGKLAFSGFLIKDGNQFRLVDFELFRVDSKGLFCDSKHEVSLFNMLGKNNISIAKPYRPIPIYDGKVPSAIILNKNTYKNVFVEIFEEGSEEALKNRNSRINKINNILKSTHRLITWDVWDNEELPSIHHINSILK